MLRRPAAVGAAVLVAVVGADQATKALVRSSMVPGTSIPVLGDLVRLTHVRNTGAAFGMLSGYPAVFITVSLLVLAGALVYWIRVRPKRAQVVVPLALLASGAMGNLIDRALRGRVTDFVEVPFIPVFNVADTAITFGVIALMWWLLFGPADHAAAAGVDGSSVSEEAAR